jgi:hypothetical protein
LTEQEQHEEEPMEVIDPRGPNKFTPTIHPVFPGQYPVRPGHHDHD